MNSLDDLLEIVDKATPGPWVYGDNRDGRGNRLHQAKWPGKLYPIADFDLTSDEDAEYIATFSPDLMRTLLTELKETREELAKYKAMEELSVPADLDSMLRAVKAELIVEKVEQLLADSEEVEAMSPNQYDRIWIDSVRRAMDSARSDFEEIEGDSD